MEKRLCFRVLVLIVGLVWLTAACGTGGGSSYQPLQSGPTTTATATTTTTTVTSRPVAAFNASPTNGQMPVTVTFVNTSTGTVASYKWDFGDGTGSDVQSPTHTYGAVGVYTVKLTVVGPDGDSTETRSGYVTVTAPPATAPTTVTTTTPNPPKPPPSPPAITIGLGPFSPKVPGFVIKVESISGFVEATGKMVRYSESPRVFDGAMLFVCSTGKAWCGVPGGTKLADLLLNKALASAPIVNGVAELTIPVILSMEELYFEALGTWVIRLADGTLASLEKPTSLRGDFIAQDTEGNDVVLFAVLPLALHPEVTILPPPSTAEKAAFHQGEILPVRDLPVSLEFGPIINGAYAVEVVNPAVSFDAPTRKPPVRYLLDPKAFDGAKICAVSRDNYPARDDDINHLDLKQAVACGLIVDGRALLAVKVLPGVTGGNYPEDIIWVVEFKDGSRGWGEPPEFPNGPLLMKDDRQNLFTRWIVGVTLGRILEPAEVTGNLDLGRKTPVGLSLSSSATGYVAKFTNLAASFEDGRLPVRFINNPEVFKGATLCALGLGKDWKQASGTTLQTYDLSAGKVLGCTRVEDLGAAPIPILFRPGETAPYNQDMLLIVVFSDGTRAWGEPPGAPFRKTDDGVNFFIRVAVNPITKTALPPS